MAYTMKLHDAVRQYGHPELPIIDRIWNVSHGVGSPERERNARTDVELVQILIHMHPRSTYGLTEKAWSAVRPTGVMDAATTLAVSQLMCDNELKRGGHWRISPARAGAWDYRRSAKDATWQFFICGLNAAAQFNRANDWLELPQRASHGLRAELTREPRF
jgi:hypothetical protein